MSYLSNEFYEKLESSLLAGEQLLRETLVFTAEFDAFLAAEENLAQSLKSVSLL